MTLRKAAAIAVTAGTVLLATPLASPAQAATAPTVSAKGAYLLDNETGTKLFSKYADYKRPMASTTKIMTARVVLGQTGLDLDRKVTIRQAYRDYVTGEGASTADLRTGDRVTVRQLLYAMMLPSGCDAAYALADTFGTGDTRSARVKSFIGKMNSTAKSLGMKNTKFDSFDGISKGSNASTPRDLTKLARDVMKNTTFKKIVATKSYTAKTITKTGSTRTMAAWNNTNLLLGWKGTIGIKTGSGTEAKYCLVFAATRSGKTVMGTVLTSTNETTRMADVKKLMDYGFATL